MVSGCSASSNTAGLTELWLAGEQGPRIKEFFHRRASTTRWVETDALEAAVLAPF